MAEIKGTDLFQKDITKMTIQDFQALLKVLEETEQAFMSILEASVAVKKQGGAIDKNNVKQIESTTKAVEEGTKAVEGLNKVQKQRKKLLERLAIAESEEGKQLIEIQQEINKVNRATRQQIKINQEATNKYKVLTRQTNEAQAEFKRLAAELGVNSKEAQAALKVFEKFDNELREINDTVRDGRRDVGRYRLAVESLNKGVSKFSKISLGAIGVLTGLFQAFKTNSDVALGFEQIVQSIGLGVSIFARRVVEAVKASNGFFDLFANLKNAFEGFNEELDKSIDLNNEALKQQRELERQALKTTRAISELRLQQETLTSVANDDTLSLERQAKAAEDLANLQAEIFVKEQSIAKSRLDIAKERLSADSLNLDKQREFTEAFIALRELEAQREAEILENQQRLREIRRDNIELDLDQLIDIGDKIRTLLDKIAQDESRTFEERFQALEDFNTNLEESFRKQAEKIKEGTGVLFDIDDLINESDVVKLNQRIKALGLDKVRQDRLRDIIQERLQAVQDLNEAQKTLNKSEEEANILAQKTIAQEIALNEAKKENADLTMILEALEQRRLEIEIESLQTRLKLAKQGSAEFLEIQSELNEKLLEQQQTRINKQVNKEKERQEKIAEIEQTTIAAADAINERIGESRESAINDELEALDRREGDIVEREQRRAQLEQERLRNQQRQRQIEAGLAALEAFRAGLREGKSVLESAGQTSVVLDLINALPAFWEGTERVENDLNPVMNTRDGYVARFDGGERIMTTAQNNALPDGVGNWELVSAYHKLNRQERQVSNFDDTKLLQKMGDVEAAINKKPVYQGNSYNSFLKLQKDVIRAKNLTKNIHTKVNF